MNQEIKQDIIGILKSAIRAVKRGNISSLAELSNHINHNSLIFQDEDAISLAVMVYALSKIIKRREGEVPHRVVDHLKMGMRSLKQDNTKRYRKAMEKVLHYITEQDDKLRMYALHVINQAQIKKGSSLFEHGLSLGRVAELLGLSRWELVKYIGKTNIPDTFHELPDIKGKLEFSRKLFHLK